MNREGDHMKSKRKEKLKLRTFKASITDIDSGEFLVTLQQKDADDMGINEQDRVKVTKGGKSITAIVQTSNTLVEEHNAMLYARGARFLSVEEGDEVVITPTGKPSSVDFIKAKMDGEKLTNEQTRTIVSDIVERRLSQIELSAYVISNYINGMDMQEITDLTLSMVETGETIDFAMGPVYDFHSVGGSPGNKVTLLVVPIVMAAGLMIPKTSSRAISSACGTADILEVLCNVTLSTDRIKEIAQEIGGTIAWGGGVNLAPADDLIIHVEYPLGIDPHGQLLASVMAKKKAGEAEYLVLDIPMGPGTKVPDEEAAEMYARDFIELGNRLGIKVECAITYGGQPVGHAIGPALEAKEALSILEGAEGPNSTIMKATHLAGIILEMGGLTEDGQQMAMELLKNGKALEKFRELMKEQGSDNHNIKSDEIVLGQHSESFYSENDGYVDFIDNKLLVKIARAAGAPKDKGAGIVVEKKGGRKVTKGEKLITLYADNKIKFEDAKRLIMEKNPIRIEGMLLARIPEARKHIHK